MQINPSEVSQLIEIRRGDTQRIVYDQLLLGGTPINLTNQTVSLVFHDPKTATTVKRLATVTSPLSGSVQYQFVEEDIAETGSRLMEWEIRNGENLELTIPSSTYLKMNILPDLR